MWNNKVEKSKSPLNDMRRRVFSYEAHTNYVANLSHVHVAHE